MNDEEFMKKLQDLVSEYACKKNEGDCDPETKELKKDGKLVIIQGQSEDGEMPEEVAKLIDFIRRG